MYACVRMHFMYCSFAGFCIRAKLYFSTEIRICGFAVVWIAPTWLCILNNKGIFECHVTMAA